MKMFIGHLITLLVVINLIPTDADIPTFTNDELILAVNHANESIYRMNTLESTIADSNVYLRNGTVSHAQLLDSLPSPEAKDYDKVAQHILKASLYLYNLKCAGADYEEECVKNLSTIKLPNSTLLDKCQEINDDRKLYSYRRLLPAKYENKLYSIFMHPRIPTPKAISDYLFELHNRTYLTQPERFTDLTRSLSVVQWAQFIEHDLAKTVVQSMRDGTSIECCSYDMQSPSPRYKHPSCLPLRLNETDTYYKDVTCINYVRSALGVSSQCKFGAAQQLNQATNQFDLSQLYGIDDTVTRKLRTLSDGEMKASNENAIGSDFLPIADDDESFEFCLTNANVCYKAGDSRVNANPFVTSLYTMFLRLHNHIARHVKRTNTNLTDDESIFQNARKVTTAIYQKIIYEEWIKTVLGQTVSDTILSAPKNTNDTQKDDDDDDDHQLVSNEFANVAIRFYYTMFPGEIRITGSQLYYGGRNHLQIVTKPYEDIIELEDQFYKPNLINDTNKFDGLEEAILTQSAMAVDTCYVPEVAHELYMTKHKLLIEVGSDALALDINRGRDHGIGSYVDYIGLRTGVPVNSWNDLRQHIKSEELKRLQDLYVNIGDIDLLMGLLSEPVETGSMVGPTLRWILQEQFINSRINDNNFYQFIDDKETLDLIKSYTGTKFVCDTTSLESVPKNIFQKPSIKNPTVNCSSV